MYPHIILEPCIIANVWLMDACWPAGSALTHSRRCIISRADESTSPAAPTAAEQPAPQQPPAAADAVEAQQQATPSASMSSMEGTQKRVRTPDSTDPIASFMSRRFG
jgi:hypothetical protein